jgi:hypothetical protein
MQKLEARNFYETRVFGFFPGVKSWIDSRGAVDAAGVYAAWYEAMEDVELRDAELVLKELAKGNISIPASWEFGPKFVALCNLEKAKRVRSQNAGQLRDELSNRSSGAMAHAKSFPIWNDVWIPLLDRVQRGEITSEFAHQQWREALENEFALKRLQGVV